MRHVTLVRALCMAVVAVAACAATAIASPNSWLAPAHPARAHRKKAVRRTVKASRRHAARSRATSARSKASTAGSVLAFGNLAASNGSLAATSTVAPVAGSATTPADPPTTTADPPPLLPPVNALPPTISGTLVDGQVLTASNGTWLVSPTSFGYQWKDCDSSSANCSTIAGAMASSYTLADSDIGHTIRVEVTGANGAGSASATSAPTAPVAPPPAPADTSQPVVTGTAVEGQTLSATTGSWTNNPESYGYAWQDCNSSGASCANISGTSASSYTLVSHDVGHTIRAVVTTTNAGGSASAASSQTAVVTPPPVPSTIGLPQITGTAVQGDTLVAASGSWTNNPTSYGYLWEDCNSSGVGCSSIGGATASSYKLQSSDVGHMVEVTVTASNSGGSGQATSSSVGPVQATPQAVAPSNTGVPTISGTSQAGQTLTAGPGTWSGDTPMTYSYAWSDGTTGHTDTLSNSDVAQKISVTVTAKNDGGSDSATSQSVGPVTSSSPPSSGTNCAGIPGSGAPSYASLDACGFPSPDTTGVPSGTALTPYAGPSNITTAGTTISHAEITEDLTISANNVTIEDSDIDIANVSTGAIRIGSGVTGAVVEYDSIHGTSATQAGNLQAAVWNTNYSDGANAVTIDHVDFYDGQRILHGPGTLQNSFCLNNVAVSGAHQECIYEGGGSITINHNTLLVDFTQTAAIYLSTDFAPLGTVQVTNNLLAGGGYTFYGGNTSSASVGSLTVTGNRWSRLYYSTCGYYGTDAYMPSTYTWSGNVWDDTGQTVSP